jgi:hypothetical protein
MDAPWRMEPDPSGRYGAIPITVSIMDNDAAEEESVAGAEYASISKIVVKEKVGLAWRSTEYPLSRFHEIEAYKGRWDRNSARNFSSAPCMPASLASMTPGVAAFAAWAAACPSEFPGGGLLCRNWRASNGCAGVDVGKLSDKGGWHGTLLYTPQATTPGRRVLLRIEAHLKEDDLIFDDDETVAHDVSVLLAPAPLPKFSADWAYGDLHYHTQISRSRPTTAPTTTASSTSRSRRRTTSSGASATRTRPSGRSANGCSTTTRPATTTAPTATSTP